MDILIIKNNCPKYKFAQPPGIKNSDKYWANLLVDTAFAEPESYSEITQVQLTSIIALVFGLPNALNKIISYQITLLQSALKKWSIKFNEFQQIDRSSIRRFGIKLVKKILFVRGIELRVDSIFCKGITMSFPHQIKPN